MCAAYSADNMKSLLELLTQRQYSFKARFLCHDFDLIVEHGVVHIEEFTSSWVALYVAGDVHWFSCVMRGL